MFQDVVRTVEIWHGMWLAWYELTVIYCHSPNWMFCTLVVRSLLGILERGPIVGVHLELGPLIAW